MLPWGQGRLLRERPPARRQLVDLEERGLGLPRLQTCCTEVSRRPSHLARCSGAGRGKCDRRAHPGRRHLQTVAPSASERRCRRLLPREILPGSSSPTHKHRPTVWTISYTGALETKGSGRTRVCATCLRGMWDEVFVCRERSSSLHPRRSRTSQSAGSDISPQRRRPALLDVGHLITVSAPHADTGVGRYQIDRVEGDHQAASSTTRTSRST